ncbi:MAG: hypothetical protein MRJ67_10905 [Nitrospirales bacterium]|nr:hypothetical protein [Nitrospirales bacterium]
MQRYKILHRTYYNFSGPVTLGPHYLRLRPREDYALHIESLSLRITPPATLLWHWDVESNSVATATFHVPTNQLAIESEVIIQQFNEAPLNFLVADYALNYPFTYQPDDRIILLPYIAFPEPNTKTQLPEWIAGFWQSNEPIQTFTLVQQLGTYINQTLSYRVREEPGVQTVGQTLEYGTGSCRDFALLFMEASTVLGSCFALCYRVSSLPTSSNRLWCHPCLGRSLSARGREEGI